MWNQPQWYSAVNNTQLPNLITEQQLGLETQLSVFQQQQILLQNQIGHHTLQPDLSFVGQNFCQPVFLSTLAQAPPPPPPPVSNLYVNVDSNQASFQEEVLPFEYPFPYTGGQQSVEFYKYFYQHCTGKRTPELNNEIKNGESVAKNLETEETREMDQYKNKDCKKDLLCELEDNNSPPVEECVKKKSKKKASKRNRTDSMNSIETANGRKRGKEVTHSKADKVFVAKKCEDEIQIIEDNCSIGHVYPKQHLQDSFKSDKIIDLTDSLDESPKVSYLTDAVSNPKIPSLLEGMDSASRPKIPSLFEGIDSGINRKTPLLLAGMGAGNNPKIPSLLTDMDSGSSLKIWSLLADTDSGSSPKIPSLLADMDAGSSSKVPSLLADMDAGSSSKVPSLLADMDAGSSSKVPSLLADMDAGSSLKVSSLLADIDAGSSSKVPSLLADMDVGTNPNSPLMDMDAENESYGNINIERKWYATQYGKEHFKNHPKSPYSGGHRNLVFSVATYNILAQKLLQDHSYLYRHCDPEVLSWDYRSVNLLNEIKSHQPDVLCLQEVEEDHFMDFFLPELQKLGYDGVYKKRSGSKPDGCATFYKTKVFKLVDSAQVEYQRPGVSLLDRDNIAVVLLLHPRKDRSKNSNICISNTHLLYNPKRGDIKLAQLQVLFAEIDKIARKKIVSKPWKSLYHPVIMCGDFNLVPYSNVYEFLLKGSLDFNGLPVKSLSGQEYYSDRQLYSGNILEKTLLPKSAGISDQCQYVDIFKSRYLAYEESKNKKKKKTKKVSPAKKELDKMELEDGEIEISSDEEENSKLFQSVEATNNANKTTDAATSQNTDTASSLLDTSTDQMDISSDLIDTIISKDDIEEGEWIEVQPDKKKQSIRSSEGTSSQPISKDSDIYCDPAIVQVFRATKDVSGSSKEDGKHQVEKEKSYRKNCNHSKGKLAHNLNLASVYSHNYKDEQNKWREEVTTNHSRANYTLDYIFYSVDDKEVQTTKKGRIFAKKIKEGRLKLLEKFELLCDNELEDAGGLPNVKLSSDHLLLSAKFLWKLK